MAVKVIDAIMGAGKTTAMINYINASSPHDRYMFVTPFLDEVTRIQTMCPGRDFVTPESFNKNDPDQPLSKLVDLKDQLRSGKNIATTHALFTRFDDEVKALIQRGGYILVMDEVAKVFDKLEISPYDLKRFQSATTIDEHGQIFWKDTEKQYYGVFNKYKHLCDNGWLWYYTKSSIIQVLPISLFKSFREVYLMTYMFEHQFQRCYFDLFGIEYEQWGVEGNSPETYHLVDHPTVTPYKDFSKLITIFMERKLIVSYREYSTLSLGWFEKKRKGPQIKQLTNHIYNFFRNYKGAKASEVMWTSYLEQGRPGDPDDTQRAPYVKPRGYMSGFLSCNARATNLYRNRHICAYAINRFPNPEITGFLAKNNIALDRDQWALSEMLQWIWRSCIRDGKPIQLYIPSKRMRELLNEWIANPAGMTPHTGSR